MPTILPKPGTPGYEQQLHEWNQDERPQQYAAIIICLAAATAAVAVRLYSQKVYGKGFGWDDLCITIALVIVYAQSIASFESLAAGAGLHQLRVLSEDTDPPRGLERVYINYWIVSVLWAPGVMFVKLSILILYRRFFYVNQKWLNIGLWANGLYAISLGIAATFVFIFQCLPVDYYWRRFVVYYGYPPPEGTCLPQLPHLVTPQILSTFSDLVILFLPIPCIATLSIQRTRKIGILFLFLLGAFTVGCGIARIAVIFRVSNEVDVTWKNIDTVTFTVVECGVGIVCASIPPSAQAYKAILRRLGIVSLPTTAHIKRSSRRNFFSRRRNMGLVDSVEVEIQKLEHGYTVPMRSKDIVVEESAL